MYLIKITNFLNIIHYPNLIKHRLLETWIYLRPQSPKRRYLIKSGQCKVFKKFVVVLLHHSHKPWYLIYILFIFSTGHKIHAVKGRIWNVWNFSIWIHILNVSNMTGVLQLFAKEQLAKFWVGGSCVTRQPGNSLETEHDESSRQPGMLL
jgi:hypothetical protein